MIFTGLASAGLFYCPYTRAPGAPGRVKLFLFSLYLLNSCMMDIHGE